MRELSKANKYQKRSRSTLCIMLLLALIIIMFIIMIAKVAGGNRKQHTTDDVKRSVGGLLSSRGFSGFSNF